MQDTGLLVRASPNALNTASSLLYGSCQGNSICWFKNSSSTIWNFCISLCCVQQTGKALVLKQWGQGADKALSKQFPGCQEVSWAHSGPCTQSPMSAMSPENLLCNFKICLPFPGRVLLSHLGKHFHWLPSPYWKICKMFAYFWQWF